MYKRFLIFFIFIISPQLYSQSGVGVINQVEDLWNLAAANNDFKIYALKEKQSETDYKIARNSLLPQISFYASGQNNFELPLTPVPGELLGQPGQTAYMQFGKKVVYNTGVSINKSLLDWQKKYQSRLAKEQVNLTKAEKEAYEQNLHTQIAHAYYTLLIIKSSIIISEKDLEIATNLLQINQDKFNQGLLNEIQFNQIKINYNWIVQNTYSNKKLYEETKLQLFELLDLKPDTEMEFTESVEFSNFSDISIPQLQEDKNLALYPSILQMQTYKIKSLKANFYPKVNLTRNIGFQQFQDSVTIDLDGDSWSKNSYVGLNLTLPVFNGFLNENQLKSAKMEKQIKELEYKNESDKRIINDKILLESFVYNKQLTVLSYENFKLMEHNLKLNLQKMDEGIISLEVYLNAFEDYLQAENNYLQNLSEMLMDYAEIIARN